MDDVYFIIATAVFAMFVIFFIWLLFRYLRSANTLVLDTTHLSEKDKEILASHCSEMRRARLEKEREERSEEMKNIL